MTYQTVIFILSISGSLIIILLAIIGFFTKKLIETVGSLQGLVAKLENILEVEKTHRSDMDKQNEADHCKFHESIRDNTQRITEAEKKILVIETKTNK